MVIIKEGKKLVRKCFDEGEEGGEVVTDVPVMRIGDTETDLMLASDGRDVFVVLKRGDVMKCVIRFVENGKRFIRCAKLGKVFDVKTDGENGLYWDTDRSIACAETATVVKKLGESNQYIGAAEHGDGVDIFFCNSSGTAKKPIMRLRRGGMFMYRSGGRCGPMEFSAHNSTAPYYYGAFDEREECL